VSPVDLTIEPPPSPSDAQVSLGLRRFVDEVRARYGANLRGVYLFGSRARGDNRPDSDADVAVVIADGDWNEVVESVAMANDTFEILLDQSLDIQPRAIAESHWRGPERYREAWLVRNIMADACRIDAPS
jgi:predicted nucleotidyltransferase